MNQALLSELQSVHSYPCVTVLINTTPGKPMNEAQGATVLQFVDQTRERLMAEVERVPGGDRENLVVTLLDLLRNVTSEPATQALALCVSADHVASVRLGRPVQERVIIDDTFATRDLVADLNRTASFRVVSVSDRKCRMFIGDRQRLVEEHNDLWPIVRDGDGPRSAWSARVNDAMRAEHDRLPLPIVVAGVDRSVRETLRGSNLAKIPMVGAIPGNHDRTRWTDLHNLAWPLVTDWLRTDVQRSKARLDEAKSKRLFAGGLDEVWVLANEGRVELLAVEDSFAVAARINGSSLERASDPTLPDVTDDVVDDLIELVLHRGGSVVIAADGDLVDHQRVAAILRY
jgi:Bacterial archaeo-eukaryotic release factor family 3